MGNNEFQKQLITVGMPTGLGAALLTYFLSSEEERSEKLKLAALSGLVIGLGATYFGKQIEKSFEPPPGISGYIPAASGAIAGVLAYGAEPPWLPQVLSAYEPMTGAQLLAALDTGGNTSLKKVVESVLPISADIFRSTRIPYSALRNPSESRVLADVVTGIMNSAYRDRLPAFENALKAIAASRTPRFFTLKTAASFLFGLAIFAAMQNIPSFIQKLFRQ